MTFTAVMLAQTRFGGSPPQPDWQIARELSARQPVLYVDPPTFVHDAARHRDWRHLRSQLEQVDEHLHVLRPVATPGADRPRFARIGDRALTPQIRRAAAAVLPEGPRVVIACDVRRGLLPGLARDLLVYCQQDRVPADPSLRFPEHLVARHDELVRRADLVTGVADVLVEEARPFAQRVMLLPNGAEYERFATPCPPPTQLPPGKVVVGYAGGVTNRLDYELLTAVADAEPDWIVAIVGPVTTEVPTRPNILVTGARPYDEMPAWLQRFDVGVIPYWMNTWNDACFPLKTYEYLAAGRPVVSTPLPMLRGLEPYVRFGQTAAEFLAAVRTAVAEGPAPEQCQGMARTQSWTARSEQLEAEVTALLDGERSPVPARGRP